MPPQPLDPWHLSTPHGIYQLLAHKTDDNVTHYASFISGYEAALACYQGKLWDKAIALFTNFLADYPDDKAAKLFIERCQAFKNKKDIGDWDGVWVYSKKDE